MSTYSMGARALAFIILTRPVNVVMTVVAVALGYGLSGQPFNLVVLFHLVLAAACATAFGNAVNDLADVKTDAVSHPQRPLPAGVLTPAAVWTFASLLACISLAAGFHVSPVHGIGVLAPLLLLSVYAIRLKGTPLAGNILISLMVAYPLLFGAIGTPGINRLLLPALLAFILNLEREIIKDLQDDAGDRKAGIVTTAIFSDGVVKTILGLCSVSYLTCLFLPYMRHDFGMWYAVIAATGIIPVHLIRAFFMFAGPIKPHLGLISTLIKIEMLLGLAVIAIDGFIK